MWHIHAPFYEKMKKKNQNQAPREPEIYPATGRPMLRPYVRIGRAIFLCVLTLVLLAAVTGLAVYAAEVLPAPAFLPFGAVGRFVCLYLLLLMVTLIICAKRILIFLIRVYQRYAPYSVRCDCIYIPNCSEYMILSIQKYGVIRGVKKGTNRLFRCPPRELDDPGDAREDWP